MIEMPVNPPDGVLVERGQPVVVIRPKDPVKAMAIVDDIATRQRLGRISPYRAQKEVKKLIQKYDFYEFRGWLAKDRKTIILDGAQNDQVCPGDQFISAYQFSREFTNLSHQARGAVNN